MRAQYCNVIHVTTPLTACIQSTLSIQISNQIREKALFLWKNWNKTKLAVRNKIIAVSTGTVYVLTVSCQRGPQTPVYNRILIRLTRIYESSICVFLSFLIKIHSHQSIQSLKLHTVTNSSRLYYSSLGKQF